MRGSFGLPPTLTAIFSPFRLLLVARPDERHFLFNNLSLLPNKWDSPPLRADPVHPLEILFHTRAPVLFQVMNLVRDQHILTYSRWASTLPSCLW